MRRELISKLEAYLPFNEQEKCDREIIISRLKNEEDIFTRNNNTAHVTVSGWVVNRERTKTIMAYHNIYKSWAWLGGHADGNENLAEVALKEVMEECGAVNAGLVDGEIFSLEVLTVNGHVKKGKYVPSHLHLNITYLVEVDESDALTIKEDENSNVKWFTFEEAVEASSEPWFKEWIYPKLVGKLTV